MAEKKGGAGDQPLDVGIAMERVGPENLDRVGIGCIVNRGHVGYDAKVRWLKERFREGLRLLLLREETGEPLGFLEYVPGEHAWRPVAAEGWLFVHCLWVYAKGQKVGGLGSRLIRACLKEARTQGARGVAALVSDGPWMVGREVFQKNGFQEVDARDRFSLVIHRLAPGPAPAFREISQDLSGFRGLHLIYAPQCPYLPKSVKDLKAVAREHGLELKVTILESAKDAQSAPVYYGVFTLLWNGRVLSDHYVSAGRFRNLLRTEILPTR